MKVPRVLHLVEYLYLGGIEKLLEQLAINSSDRASLYFFSYETDKVDGIGAKIQQMGFPLFTYKKKAGTDLKLLFKLIKVIKENKIDVVHTHDFGPTEYALFLKIRFPHLKIIHTQHTIHHFVSNKKYTAFFSLASYFFSQILCVSEYVRERMLLNCPFMAKRKVKVVSNGVDTKLFVPANQIEDKTKTLKLISVARISPEKNLNYLLETCLKLKNAGIPFHFTHAGTSAIEQRVKDFHQKVEEMGLSDVVTLKGFCHDTVTLLQDSDIFLSSSLTEGHPVSVLEAMSCGVPCLISDIAAHRELPAKGIVLYDLNNPSSLFEMICDISVGEHDLVKLGQEARESVIKQYSIETMVDQYVENYQ